jgi:two-component system nitrogen regulation response regulator NtrX
VAGEAIQPLHEARDAFERGYILRALDLQRGNISRTADVLRVERSNLYRKMRGFGIGQIRRPDEDGEG